MPDLFDPAYARIVAYCLIVAYVGGLGFTSAMVRRPAIAAAASSVCTGFSVMVFAFVLNVPNVGRASIVLVLGGVAANVLLTLALAISARYGGRAPRPKPAHVRKRERRLPTLGGGDELFPRLVRSSVTSIEDGHCA